MYEAHYGFTEKPFNLTPDPKFLYLSARHTEAFAHLEFGRRERGGFVVITGEVGTGKTTLARYFLGRLEDRTATAVVLYPALTAPELLRSILEDLHVTPQGASLKDLVDALHRFLLEARSQGRDVVLLIDEAQDLSPEVLEQIRLISNLETDTEKLIQIVLLGQSELHEMLGRRELRQLAQRVTARYHLSPLNRQETEEYLRHRLGVAGGEGKVAFTSGALAAVHRLSGGIPRLLNLIGDRALLAGYVKGTREIDAGMVRRAAREVGAPPPAAPHLRREWIAVLGAALAAVFVAMLWPTSAVQAPAVVATPPPPPTTVAASVDPQLESVLLAQPPEGSLEASAAQVQALWGGGVPLQRTSFRTHLDQVRRLDLPVVLEMFHPGRREPCYLAVLRLEGEEAVVSAGGDETLRVPLPALDRLWTRQAVFLWRDFDSLGGGTDTARGATWAQGVLSRHGYAEAGPDLMRAIARFQREADLLPDGVVGSRTLMALYSLGDYPRPHLKGKRLVSLILEALKKLEREKKTPERGFLVTTRAVWPAAGARPLPYILAGAALLGVGAFGTWLALDGSHRPRPAPAPAAPPPTTLRAAVPVANPTALPPILLPAPAPRPLPEPRRPVATRSVPKDVPSPEATGPAELRLEAVSRRDGLPIAVLSGHLVHEGDSFDNVRVLRIGDTEVEIEVDGQRRVLSF